MERMEVEGRLNTLLYVIEDLDMCECEILFFFMYSAEGMFNILCGQRGCLINDC